MLNLINWRTDFEKNQDNLGSLYHHNSFTSKLSPQLYKARFKAFKNFFLKLGGNLQISGHCYSAPAVPLLSREGGITAGEQVLLNFYHLVQSGKKGEYSDFTPFVEELNVRPVQLDDMDIYFIPVGTNGGLEQVYYFNQEHAVLEQIKTIRDTDISLMFPPQILSCLESEDSKQLKGIYVCVANLYRIQMLFGERGYRNALLRAGGIAEQLHMEVSKITGQREARITSDFYDKEVNKLLDLDGYSEVSLVCVAIHEVI
ncbi:hypothetical protein HQN87_19670 [Paenibacillus tritici]|uniref:SagB/ThcOx family dehydrogenase n=1 Tax=Paenibacillus tritici TaxID=1873425 RepID=A0ABX2DS92_9BACL|nr:hypothetical protein [Paenibacillus tritici]NQX47558.1 hypothetical protein [Paenibacillus tritici]